MPSKGNPVIHTRISHELHAEMMDQIQLSNMTRRESPWTVAEWVEQAIAEKIAKMKRSRKQKEQRLPRRSEVEA
jgi:uncharacterized protein YifN (PemK superfamily)